MLIIVVHEDDDLLGNHLVGRHEHRLHDTANPRDHYASV
jgi:hypothetical protein